MIQFDLHILLRTGWFNHQGSTYSRQVSGARQTYFGSHAVWDAQFYRLGCELNLSTPNWNTHTHP